MYQKKMNKHIYGGEDNLSVRFLLRKFHLVFHKWLLSRIQNTRGEVFHEPVCY